MPKIKELFFCHATRWEKNIKKFFFDALTEKFCHHCSMMSFQLLNAPPPSVDLPIPAEVIVLTISQSSRVFCSLHTFFSKTDHTQKFIGLRSGLEEGHSSLVKSLGHCSWAIPVLSSKCELMFHLVGIEIVLHGTCLNWSVSQLASECVLNNSER